VDVHTRLANIHDAQLIASLGRITFSETFGHLFRDKCDLLEYNDATFSDEKISQSLIKPTNIFWISFVDNHPVGYAKLKLDSPNQYIDNKKVCQLQKIYVLSDFLSLKIGYQLQLLVVKKAAEMGFEKIWLSVLNSNERAIKFYLKNDYKIIGDHDFDIGKEHFEFKVMAKNI